ncbi:hypothetical protein FRX31_012209 [Thalictrum thalictroides]|uniref:Uncharacterized protein n=1 Tax=Thalictrum thalictroides TaxID=46969 RepID=A0A7J6WP27_THATH|nr:hypothetical protein FRX31_012209 [Thalictrum thalictroides]
MLLQSLESLAYMTTSLGAEGQIQMFSDLARDGVTRDDNNGSEGKQIATEGGDAQTEPHRDVNCTHREPISAVQTNLSSTVGSEVVVSEGLQQMGAIAESIYNGKSKEDNNNFVEFFVMPPAKELGMTTSMSKEGKKRMFSKIASQSQTRSGRIM